MDKIYHGCTMGYLDRSHVILKKDENCLTPTADYFWKDPHDVINSVKTRSQTEKQKIICLKTMMDYFNKKGEKQNYI